MALINLRNALMAGKRLPYDAEVEYLQSSGTQWIDTDASKVATASRYVCAGKYMENSNQAMMWSHGYRGIRSYGAYISFVTGKYATTNTTVGYDTECIIEFDAASLKGILTSLGGTELANVTIGSSSASGGLRIFAASETATGYRASQSRIYFMRVYDTEGNILLDFIPVRKGTVGYLYDRVSGKLFGNAGTGDFVLGPDVVPVEWLDNGGTAYIDTEYIFKTKPRVVTNCMITDGADRDLFGTSTVDASCFIFNFALNSSTWLFYRYGSTSALTATASKPSVGSKIHIDASDNVYVDDALILTRTGTYDFSQGSTHCRIFAARSILPSRIYDLSMWDGDALVRKMLPVRVGSGSTWEGAMMDVLTRRIYRNSGTGAFGYGNDLKYPIPAE